MNSLPTILYPLLLIVSHFVVYTLFFTIVQRPLFCLYNRKHADKRLTLRDACDITWHGLYTDVKVAAYLTAVPLLLVWGYVHFPHFSLSLYLIIYNIAAALVVALLSVADTVLYDYWQYKIEASVLNYLHSLRGAFASVSVPFLVVAFTVVAMVAALLAVPLYLLAVNSGLTAAPLAGQPWWTHLMAAVVALLLIAILFCVIRGMHIRPDSPVYSYYSNHQFLNHCAVNPVYNFIYSLHLKKDDFAHQFQAFDKDYCEQKFEHLFPTTGTPRLQLLNTPCPNILVIVWESLCAHFIGTLGGKQGVMPHFDRLSREGVYFTNCWASSFRTDRGLVAILSGYPGQPTTSIILHTSKLPHLPAVPRQLRDTLGYETMAVHGGPLNIFHKSDYYWASGHDRLVEQKHFPTSWPATRWGVHDGKIFEWLEDDIMQKTKDGKRWFTTFQTLSSHEPFHVPYDRIKDNAVDNAYAYVDEVFGRFIDALKVSPAWNDLLVIVTGDHGQDTRQAPDKDRNTHIPLLMLGGAVRQPMTIDTLMCQTDIAATLLGQMGLPHSDYTFSRDVTAATYTYPFALHTFNNGFIFRDATGVTHYDNESQRPLAGHDPQREETAKVILQTLYTDLSQR